MNFDEILNIIKLGSYKTGNIDEELQKIEDILIFEEECHHIKNKIKIELKNY